MRYLLHLLLFFGLAGAIGLGLTGVAVNRNLMFGEVRIGAWVAFPSIGTANPDPYARASIARRGRIPLALGDGIEFQAMQDSSGDALSGSCSYEIQGGSIPARYWTMAVQSASLATSPGRNALTSVELLRQENGNFSISAAASARPANWIATPRNAPFTLVLRLYDTPLSSRSVGANTVFPRITKGDCA